jgi:hypothetical protein
MRSRARGRLPNFLLVILAACASTFGGVIASRAATDDSPSGCTDIQSVPPIYSGIQYGAAIQGMFDDFNGMDVGCTMCHFTPPPTPSGNLNLDDGVSWVHLINIPSDEDASFTYVVPGHPERSLLFQKINCDSPQVGSRMPFGFPSDTLSPQQQALVWDWIAAGAPVGSTDGVFRNNFDVRGFTE